jgi:HK97 family phage portal protein
MAHAVTAPPRAGVIALARRIALRFGKATRSPATDHKGSATGRLIALETGAGQPVWSPRDYAAFARDGMMQNAVVYRSVRMIAEAAASVPLLVYEDGSEVEGHPLAELLARPNPAATGTELLEAFYGFLLVAGNAYLEAVAFGGELRELHALRPDRMKVIPGADGWPAAWEYSAGGETVRIAGEVAPGVPRILHLKLFHPANDHYGLSPIEAAATAIDIHNAASRWNKALLDNSARPSGALVYGGGQHLPPEQFDRLKEELSGAFQGVRNAGRPMLLEGGLDWKAMSLSPRDMDFIEAKHAAAREIALALGVPPMLLGIPGDNTYSNLVEANRAFWRQTVLPLVTRAAKGIAHWLSPAWDGSVCLVPDLDQVEALAPEREALWARLENASFLTDDEKRAAVGYGAKGDDQETVAQKYNSNHDDRGRFTFAPGGPRIRDGQRVAQLDGPQQYSVSLQDEEARGGHTISRHVAKTNEELLETLRAARIRGLFVTISMKAHSTFESLEAANDFTNQLLKENKATVDLVATGKIADAWLERRVGSPTGREAFRPEALAEPYIRPTYKIGTYIQHDPSAPRGYRVRTAYPLNDYPK